MIGSYGELPRLLKPNRRRIQRKAHTGKFTITQEVKEQIGQHPDVTYLALANLVGGWKENNDADMRLLGRCWGKYETWLHKARDIALSDSPLSLKNGIGDF